MALDALQRRLLAGFLGESQDLAQKVTLALLDLEKAEGADAVRSAFDRVARGLHTLKGSAATIGLADLADMAHLMEDLIASSRAALAAPPPAIVDSILSSLDAFTGRVKELAATEGAEAAAPAPVALADEAEERSWRIDREQVVALLDEVERLREVRLRLVERAREVEEALGALAAPSVAKMTAPVRASLGTVSRRLAADGEQAASVIESLEEGLKAVGTLPISTVLDQLERAVRDLCRQTGKEARLTLVGAEVSVDRRILAVLKSALVQLLRNAVAHGIEAPAEREERGKDRAGLITVRVDLDGNLLSVQVEDDGGGLDTERIRAKAEALGLAREELARLAPAQVHDLIFRAGLTTKDDVSGAAGRGVGLDLVRQRVQALEGHVEVHSRPGQGTTFVLYVPMELGSSPVLLVRSGDERFGLPVSAVERVHAARPAELRASASRLHVAEGDELVRVQDLAGVLGLRAPAPPEEDRPLVLVGARGERVALAVDAVLGHLDLNVRPLPREVRSLAAYQGAATLVGGELVLVLRPDWLVAAESAPIVAPSARRALVVDDALTARALYRTVLESAGYAVHAAGSAAQAVQLAARSSYEVLVCDVALADGDGVAVAKELRARLPGLAVVLVSAHDSPAERERALASGADAFLSKRDCAAGRLLAEVSTLTREGRP